MSANEVRSGAEIISSVEKHLKKSSQATGKTQVDMELQINRKLLKILRFYKEPVDLKDEVYINRLTRFVFKVIKFRAYRPQYGARDWLRLLIRFIKFW